MKNDTDDRRNLCSIEAAPDKISVFFQHLVPGASVKSSRSNDTPTGLSNSKSGERDYDTFVVARVPLIAATLPTDVLIEGVRSRNSARSRSSSIMSASVRAQSSALCACHCSPCHARGWIGMQGYAWQTGKLYYAFLLPRHRCILNPRNAMSQAFHFGDSIFNVDTSQVARVFKRNSGHWQSVSKNFY